MHTAARVTEQSSSQHRVLVRRGKVPQHGRTESQPRGSAARPTLLKPGSCVVDNAPVAVRLAYPLNLVAPCSLTPRRVQLPQPSVPVHP